VLATVARRGFETAIPLGAGASSVTVEALDAAGQVLARSAATAR
jgi:hypothetical protein